MFVNRQEELAALERAWAEPGPALFVLYGRRRIGKTELLRQFCQNRRHLFFVADLGTEARLRADFARAIAELAFGRPDAIAFPSWTAAFEFLADLARTERLVVVLDEFPYLLQAVPDLPTLLQRLWDTTFRHTRLMLVLCGSFIGMTERQLLAYTAPLYGRRTGQWKLGPLRPPDIRPFFPAYTPQDLVRTYAVLGGVPTYLLQFDPAASLLDNIQHRLLARGTVLFEEPRLLMSQSLRDPHRYFALLEAIALGRHRLGLIAQHAGLPVTQAGFYLRTLQELDLVERVVPVTETNPARSKRGLYVFRDPFLRFWFHFVYPHRSLLEWGQTEPVLERIRRSIDEFTAPIWEAVARTFVWELARQGRLGFVPRTVGRYWDGDLEVDVVALGDDEVLIGECRWSGRPADARVLADLRRKAQRLQAVLGRPRRVRLAVFARAGCRDFPKDVLCIRPEDIFSA